MRILSYFVASSLILLSAWASAQEDSRVMELEVLDSSGKPLQDATNNVATADMVFSLSVDKQGSATIELPSDASQVTLKAFCRGHVPLSVRWTHDIPLEFVFKMSRGEPIGGLVQDERGRPIEGVEVEGLLVSSRVPEEGTVLPEVGGVYGTTDGVGRWRADVATAEPVELRLKLTHDKYFSDRSFGKRRVSNGQLRSLEHIEILDDRLAPHGIVTGADGMPVREVSLHVLDGVEPFKLENGRPYDKSRKPDAVTDLEGKYRFPEPQESFAVLCLGNSGWAMVPGRRYEKNTPVEVKLTAWARVVGVLTQGDSPCTGERLQLLVHDSEFLGGDRFAKWNNVATTNDKGEFQFERLTDGYGSLRASVEYCARTELLRHDSSSEFHAPLTAGRGVQLRCVRSGHEVMGTVLALRYDESEAAIVCGMIMLTKEDESHDMVQNFFFEWGKTATIGINFDSIESAAWLRGRPKASYVGRVEANGSFRIQHVPPGSYRARVSLWCEGEPDAEFPGERGGGWHEGTIWEALKVEPEGGKPAAKLGLLEFEVYSSEE